jgi:hypothetical protein
MRKKIINFIILLTLCTNYGLYSQTVQGGISNSGVTLIVSARPNQDLAGNFSGGNVMVLH